MNKKTGRNFLAKMILVYPPEYATFKSNCAKRMISMSRKLRELVRKDNETFKS